MNNAGARAINFLRTPVATLAVLVTALVAQLPHAADVFRLAVAGKGLGATLHSYSYAVALELAVLLFVVQRRNIESYVFAVASICINLAYYALHGVNLTSIAAAPAWLISVALPVAIARYSHLIVDAAHSDATPSATPSATSETWVHAGTLLPTTAQPTQRVRQRARVEPEAEQHPTPDVAPPTIDTRTHALQMHAEGMTVAQIAEALGAKPSTVRSWVHRAREGSAT
jgi:DNA-directed RNA polymerase specialized sigma24 family protein